LNGQFAKPAGLKTLTELKSSYSMFSEEDMHSSKYGQISFHQSFEETACLYSVFCTFIF